MQDKLYGSDKNCVPKYKGFFGKNFAPVLFTILINWIKI